MKKNKRKLKVIAITTDPYKQIQGFSLVFLKLFKEMHKVYPKDSVLVLHNGGLNSKLVKGNNFINLHISEHSSKLSILYNFVFRACSYCIKHKSILVVNSEIPELIVGVFMKYIYRRKVICYVYDTRARDKRVFTLAVAGFRIILIYLINNAFFSNPYNYKKMRLRYKYLVGVPVFNYDQI